MKIFNKFFISYCLFWVVTAFAQKEISSDFGNQMTTMFSAIDKSKVPDGILLDYGMEFTNVPAFNGTLTDSTAVNSKNVREIYNTLLMSRIQDVSVGFVTPDTFDANWQQARSTDAITLSGLYFKYGTFTDDALNTGKLQYSNGKFYDVASQNPYIERRTFAIAAPISTYTGFSVNIKLPQTIFYTNAASEVSKIEANFDDGLGYRTLAYGQEYTANYTTEGNKT